MKVGDKIFIIGNEYQVVIRDLDFDGEVATVSYKQSPKLNWKVPFSDILYDKSEALVEKVETSKKKNEAQTEVQKQILIELGLTHLIK